MKLEEANKLIEKISKSIEKSGLSEDNLSKVIEHLKDLRPYALKEEDPLATKTIRLIYEFLEEEAHFEVPVTLEEQVLEEEDAEETEEVPVSLGSSEENLQYMLTLLTKSDNKYNREEMRMVSKHLKAELYG